MQFFKRIKQKNEKYWTRDRREAQKIRVIPSVNISIH